MLNFLFKDRLTRKIEKQIKLKGKISILEKQEKRKLEQLAKNIEEQRRITVNTCNSQIQDYRIQINYALKNKEAQLELIAEDLHVKQDKIKQKFNLRKTRTLNKITFLQNEIKLNQNSLNELLLSDETDKKILLERSEDKNKNK